MRIHLGGIEAQDFWRELEPKLSEVERYLDDLSGRAYDALAELARGLRDIRDSLHDPGGAPPTRS